MKIAIIGTGYVGLVTGACLAKIGHTVIGVGRNQAKIEALQRGEIPIYEPKLGELVAKTAKANRLTFTTDLTTAVKDSQVIFLAVGTPPGADHQADLSQVETAAAQIANIMTES